MLLKNTQTLACGVVLNNHKNNSGFMIQIQIEIQDRLEEDQTVVKSNVHFLKLHAQTDKQGHSGTVVTHLPPTPEVDSSIPEPYGERWQFFD